MPNSPRTIFKNTVWLTVAEVTSAVLLFFLTVFLAKYLGAENYGKLAFALGIATLFAVIVDFGLSTLTTRELARNKERASKFLGNIFTLRLLLGFIFLVLMVLVVFLSGKETIVVYLVFFTSLYMVLHNLIQALNAIFRAYERMKFEALGRLIYSISILSLCIFFIWLRSSLIYFGLIYIMATLIALLFTFSITWSRFVKFKISFDLNFWKYLLKEAWPFALSLIFISIYFYMDTVMLGFMGQDKEVGWYNAVYKIVFFVLLMANILGTVFFPAISRFFKESLDKLKILLNHFSKIMIIFSIPIGLGGVILAERIVNFIFGAEYLGGVLAFQILIWSGVIVFISVVFANTLQACDKQRTYVLGVGIGAFVNIILNLILIPLFSLNGAAIATLVSQLIVLVFLFLKVNKFISIPFFGYLLKSLLSALVMGGVVVFINQLNLFFVILLGFITYLVVLLMIRGITRKELTLAKDLLRDKFSTED